ncbi:MAG TPA: VWA domain-containing protein [Bryobacteraceae bacterium]|nr:VWA domain-containing protein [Bryobacteraceae bacterium]
MKLALSFAAVAVAFGQNAPAHFTSEVRLVRLLVNVKDQKGALVGSLDKDQFTIFDDNVPQEIRFFERYTTTPLSIAVLVDTSGSTRIDWTVEVRAITKFFQALFGEGNEHDAASLFTFNYDVTEQSDFTRNANRLKNRLRDIRPEGGTSLYDAIYHAALHLQPRQGRHVLVLVSDGGNTTSSKKYGEAREAAQRADAVMYPIVVVPITNDAGRNTGGEHALQQMAADTGGRWFDATLKDLDRTFDEILRDLRAQYMVAYYPTDARQGFHQVHVELKRPDLRATTRTGYYGEDPR